MLEKVEYFVYVFIFINAYIGLYTALKLTSRNMGILDCVEYACTGIILTLCLSIVCLVPNFFYFTNNLEMS